MLASFYSYFIIVYMQYDYIEIFHKFPKFVDVKFKKMFTLLKMPSPSKL